EAEEVRHLGAYLQLLRIDEPVQNPLRAKSFFRQDQIGSDDVVVQWLALNRGVALGTLVGREHLVPKLSTGTELGRVSAKVRRSAFGKGRGSNCQQKGSYGKN
ncbi:MAG: hypothetical protein ACI91F_002977, partial [Candidatus Binatia bacterium]